MSNNVTLIPKKPVRHTLLTDTDYVVYMPLASKDTHGIVRVGDGLNITTDGLLSVDFTSDWYSDVKNDVEKLKFDVDDLGKDLDELVLDMSDLDGRVSDIEDGRKVISIYQTKSDTGLVTVNKTVVGGINELKNQTQINVNDIRAAEADISDIRQNYATTNYVDGLYSKISVGGNNSYVFETRDQFIAWLDGTFVREDSFKPDLLNIGDVIFIEEMGVPDYWVKSKSSPMTINDFREYEAKIDIPEVKADNISIDKNAYGELQAVRLKNALVRLSDVVDRSDFTGIVELESGEQYKELVDYGSVVVNGELIQYSDGGVYATPETDEEIQEQLNSIQSTLTTITPKVMRALVTPVNAPTTIELVAVDDGNAQTMIEIGDGLTLENGVLSASGGSGGVSQEDFDKLVTNQIQIKGAASNVALGGGLANGLGSTSIGYTSEAVMYASALGYQAKAMATSSIQLGSGTNNKAYTLQIRSDNIYNSQTHTLTVQNIELNGEDLATKLAGTSAKYTHNIRLGFSDERFVMFQFTNSVATAYDSAEAVRDAMVAAGFDGFYSMLPCSGWWYSDSTGEIVVSPIIGLYADVYNITFELIKPSTMDGYPGTYSTTIALGSWSIGVNDIIT